MNPRVTIRDIANKVGLHFTTVSLALRNSPRLKAATRHKIHALAKKMGYSPDPMLAALTAYRQTKRTPHFQSVLAWINNWPNRHELHANTGFHLYYQAASARAKELGYLVEEFWLREPGMTPKKILHILRARNIQGLLMAPQPRPYAYLDFDFTSFSAISFGYSMLPPILNIVTNHHFHSMKLVITKLRELGYHRLGLAIGFNWDEKTENGYMSAFILAHWQYPDLEYIPPLTMENITKENTADWVAKYLPDVVIGWDNMESILRNLGYRIPAQLGFVNLNVSSNNPQHSSGLIQNDALIGIKAVDLLVGMIHRNETSPPRLPSSTLIESEWFSGSTVRQHQKPCPSKKRKLTHRQFRAMNWFCSLEK
jgi:LacI family transcriptional regulator